MFYTYLKYLVTVLLVTFLIYHGIINERNGLSSCKWLLSDGVFKSDKLYEPNGCIAHHYSAKEIKTCFNRLSTLGRIPKVYFVGDSRLKPLFLGFLRQFTGEPARMLYNLTSLMENATYTDETISLCFFHLLTLNDLSLESWFVDSPVPIESQQQHRCRLEERPLILILSHPLADIVRNQTEFEVHLHEHMSLLSAQLRKMQNIKVIWMLSDPIGERLLSDRYVSWLSNELIDQFNQIVSEFLQNEAPEIEVWSSHRIISHQLGFPAIKYQCKPGAMIVSHEEVNSTLEQQHKQQLEAAQKAINASSEPAAIKEICVRPPNISDGIHVSVESIDMSLQIVINRFCNDHMKFFDGTCCTAAEPITLVQIGMFLIFAGTSLACLVSNCVFYLGSAFHYDTQAWPGLGSICEFSSSLARVGLILTYFFVCDRTIFFMKAGKLYSIVSLLLPICYFSIIGIFFSKQLRRDKVMVMNVDQTLECKGWLQMLVLVYHISGASQLIPVYLMMRVVVSMYVFLSGYGHFMHFCANGRGGLKSLLQAAKRYLRVIFRMNFLVVCLCLMMNRPYQFYYFVPLLSFFYTCQMLLMHIGPSMPTSQTDETMPGTALAGGRGLLHPLQVDIPHEEIELVMSAGTNAGNGTCQSGFTSVSSTGSVGGSSNSSNGGTKRANKSPDPTPIPNTPVAWGSDSRVELQTSYFLNNQCESPSAMVMKEVPQAILNRNQRGHQKNFSFGGGNSGGGYVGVSLGNGEGDTLLVDGGNHSTGSSSTASLEGQQQPLLINTGNGSGSIVAETCAVSSNSAGGDNTWIGKRRIGCLYLAEFIMLIKIALFIVLSQILYYNYTLFRNIFGSGPQSVLFRSASRKQTSSELDDETWLTNQQDDMKEWFFRWSLDRFSTAYGLIIGIVVMFLRRNGLVDCPLPKRLHKNSSEVDQVYAKSNTHRRHHHYHHEENVHLLLEPEVGGTACGGKIRAFCCNTANGSKRWRRVNCSECLRRAIHRLGRLKCRQFIPWLASFLALSCLLVYMLFALTCKTKEACNQRHPYMVIFPIMSLVVLRNAFRSTRSMVSSFFMGIGACSLELYVAQYHIWLSADTHGILLLLPGRPVLNLLVTTVILFCVSHELHQLTKKLQAQLLPDNNFKLARNLILYLFMAVLIEYARK